MNRTVRQAFWETVPVMTGYLALGFGFGIMLLVRLYSEATSRRGIKEKARSGVRAQIPYQKGISSSSSAGMGGGVCCWGRCW